MDPKLTLVLANGLELWLDAALADLRMSATPEDVAELAKAMDTGDVRVVYNIRANVISIETFDPNDETATELFRVHLGSRKPSTSDPNAHLRCYHLTDRFSKIERAAVLGCALLEPYSSQHDRTAFLAAMAQLDDRTSDSVQVLIAMKLLKGSPLQMMDDDPDRMNVAMALAMHVGGSWIEKGKGSEASPRVVVLLPPPPRP